MDQMKIERDAKPELLRVERLRKFFQTAAGVLHAVDDVSFTVRRGETLGVVGESGCGKSTLGRAILRLHEPTGGAVYFDGENIFDMDRARIKALRRDMQIIFQDPFSSLNPRMTVSQTISEAMLIAGQLSRADIQKRVFELMDTVGLARRFVNTYPHELDGGRRQRVGIARALALDPKFIVCDEPVSALDVSIQSQIINLLKDLQRSEKITYLFIAHNLAVVRHISSRIGVMYLGRLVEEAPTAQLFGAPQHPYTRALLSAVPTTSLNDRRGRIRLAGEPPSPVNPPPGCAFHTRCPYASEVCAGERPGWTRYGDHAVACHRIQDIQP